ncbi:MAG: PqqD family protein [Candidatus Acidiferrum sp.]
MVFSDRVVVPAQVLVRYLDGETVLLNLDTEKYFGLDATGTHMWRILTQSGNIEKAYSTLSGEFDVEPEVLRSHLTELIDQLVENRLIEVVPVNVESTPAIYGVGRGSA